MKIYRKEKGVSEVLGSILILLITVVLFSSVFYYVSTMPTPKSQIYAQFDAELKMVSNGTGGYCFNITVKNVGGESLDDWRTMFIVVIEFTAKQHMLSEQNFSKQVKDNKFSQGESFYYNSTWDKWEGVDWSSIEALKSLSVSISLFDNSNGQVIWSSKLQGYGNLPPVLIRLSTSPSPIILNKNAALRAIIFDPDNSDVSQYSVTMDLSSLEKSINSNNPEIEDIYNIPMKYVGKSTFQSPMIYFQDVESLNVSRPYRVKIKIQVEEGVAPFTYTAYIFLSRGTEVNGPDLYIVSSLTKFSNPTPMHGNDVVVSVTVQNWGGTEARFHLKVVDKYDGYSNKEIYINTNLGNSSDIYPRDENGKPSNFTVAAGGQTTISFTWKDIGTDADGNKYPHVAGTHTLVFEVINITPQEDRNAKYPNIAFSQITIMPRILLVDADGAPEGSSYDTSRFYSYILDTTGYPYEYREWYPSTTISSSELSKYDVVIWDLGYGGVLTSDQASALGNFYSDGGSLWIITPSEDKYLNNIDSLSYSSGEFTGKFTAMENDYVDLKLPNGELVTDEIIERIPGEKKVLYASGGTGILENSSSGNKLCVVDVNGKGGKYVFMGFELTRVKHYYHQDFIAYRILQWLGNISGRAGIDVAIEDMTIVPREPLYKEKVTITVVVSNNGADPISTKVLLKIDDRIYTAEDVTNPQDTGIIPPNGGFVQINFTWVPDVPGKHIITAIADPYNELKETNEENNIVNSYLIDTSVYVRYSTLIIYNGTEPTELEYIMNYLNYSYAKLNIQNVGSLPSNYREGRHFKRYNVVIWANATLGERDKAAIQSSWDSVGHLFLGPKTVDSLNQLDFLGVSFSDSPIKVDKSIIYGVNTQDSITNGLSLILSYGNYYTLSSNSQGSSVLFRNVKIDNNYATLESESVNHDVPTQGLGIALRTPGKIVILSFDIKQIKGVFGLKNYTSSQFTAKPYDPATQAKALLLFRILKYFGYVSLSPELATYPSDIQIIYGGENPSLPPIVGRSYMLRTTIYNYGAAGASTIVRFYDDFEWIGSQSVYLPPANVTNGIVIPSTAKIEIVWTPMFAGNRHIRVIVDPLNEVQETKWNGTVPYGAQAAGDELFNFNNEAIITRTVYYFWDNMENGAENWMHEATVMNINGESPLDFVNRKDVSTKVVGEWDTSLSSGWYWTNDSRVIEDTNGAYHSKPFAFWMPEHSAITNRKPVHVFIVLDTSGSMSGHNGW